MQIDPNSLEKGSALISISIILFLYKLQLDFVARECESLDDKYLHFFIRPVFPQLTLKNFENKKMHFFCFLAPKRIPNFDFPTSILWSSVSCFARHKFLMSKRTWQQYLVVILTTPDNFLCNVQFFP